MDVGKKIEGIRVQKGMSQLDLAEIIGTSQNTIHKIETGITKRSGFIPAIADALNLTTEALLSDNPTEEIKISPTQAKIIRKIENAHQDDIAKIESAIDAILMLSELERSTEK